MGKKKRDPNEPIKPPSAYALFFKETQAPIKVQNPNATFGEVAKIVGSLWSSLDDERKNQYKKKQELAKKEYLQSLNKYKASLAAAESGKAAENSTQDTSGESHLDELEEEEDSEEISAGNNSVTASAATGGKMKQVDPVAIQGSAPVGIQGTGNGPAKPGIASTAYNGEKITNGETMVNGVGEIGSANQGAGDPSQDEVALASVGPVCIRAGCNNPGVHNPEWEDEYCSTDCVVSHCRDVFNTWVAGNVTNNRGCAA